MSTLAASDSQRNVRAVITEIQLRFHKGGLMGFFGKNDGGIVSDIIRCDEPNYLIWKWHPTHATSGQSCRENTIRWGSSLRVKTGSMAVFVYDSQDGIHEDYVQGPFDAILDTKNLPVLSGLLGFAYDGNTPFQAEVYFINLAEIITMKFAVRYFNVADCQFESYMVPVAVRGTLNFKIADYRQFIILHRLDNFSVDDMKSQIRDSLEKIIKAVVTNAPKQYSVSVINMESRIDDINSSVLEKVEPLLAEKYGVCITDFSIAAVEADAESPTYKKLTKMTQNRASTQYVANAMAQTAADVMGKLRIANARNSASSEGLKLDSKLDRFKKVGRFITEVADDGLSNLGKVAGNAVASAGKVGKNVANGIRNIAEDRKTGSPPPIPSDAYYVAVNEKPDGPYEISVLATMITENRIGKNTLVWKKGMPTWTKAGEVNTIAALFAIDDSVPNLPEE